MKKIKLYKSNFLLWLTLILESTSQIVQGMEVENKVGINSVTQTVNQSSPYKLEGIFTTKICSLEALNPHEFKKGDIAFFDCYDMFTSGTISFFNQIQQNGVENFCLVGRSLYNKGELENCFFKGYKIRFSSLIKDDMPLDPQSTIANGLIYRNGSNDKFFADEKINALLKLLANSGTTFNRVFYFANDPFNLNFLVGKTISQPITIYFIPPKENYGYNRFLLSDQPAVHWAYSDDEETQIQKIRQNPLILADTFGHDGRELITYEKILKHEIIRKAFDKDNIVNPSLLLKTFFLDKWHINHIYFAQKLAKIYDEAIWPEVIFYAEKLMLDAKTDVYVDNYCFEILNGLIDAKYPENMKNYADQILSIFHRVTSTYLRKSCVDSFNMKSWEERESILEKAYNYTTELEIAAFLGGDALLPWFYEQNLMEILPYKIPDKVSPFTFLKKLKSHGNSIVHIFIHSLPKLHEFNYRYVIEEIEKHNPTLELLSYVSLRASILKNKLTLNDQLFTRLILDLVSLNLTKEKLSVPLSELPHLLMGVKIKDYDSFTKEISLLVSLSNQEAITCCIETTRKIYDIIPHKKEYLVKLLEKIVALESNEERRETVEQVSYYLETYLIPSMRKNHHNGIFYLSMGHECEFERAIYSLMELSQGHRKFLINIMKEIYTENFRLYTYSCVNTLNEEIAKFPLEKHAQFLSKLRDNPKIQCTYDVDLMLRRFV